MKIKTIRKKLLSLVMGDDVVKIESDVIRNGLVVHFELAKEHLNLDTLGRLCKEWCWKQGYSLQITWMLDDGFRYMEIAIWDKETMLQKYEVPANPKDTELDAIIKATEWVAKEKGLI